MRPILATDCPIEEIKLPTIISPKVDGVRGLIIDGVVCGRSLKPIPNKHTQKILGRPEFNGFDGELVVGSAVASNCLNATTSGLMSIEGEPDVTFWVFDDFTAEGTYKERLARVHARLESHVGNQFKDGDVCIMDSWEVDTRQQITDFEAKALDKGFEGIIARSSDGPYKHGKSTVKENYFVRVKRFTDSEAYIIGITELKSNQNEATTDERGYKKRSSHQANKVPMGTTGALIVMDMTTKVVFKVAVADQQIAAEIWQAPWSQVFGRIVKYKKQATGEKDKPRHPTFLGFRDEVDL